MSGQRLGKCQMLSKKFFHQLPVRVHQQPRLQLTTEAKHVQEGQRGPLAKCQSHQEPDRQRCRKVRRLRCLRPSTSQHKVGRGGAMEGSKLTPQPPSPEMRIR